MEIALKIALCWCLGLLAAWLYAKANRSKSRLNDKYYYLQGDGVPFSVMWSLTKGIFILAMAFVFVYWLFNEEINNAKV